MSDQPPQPPSQPGQPWPPAAPSTPPPPPPPTEPVPQTPPPTPGAPGGATWQGVQPVVERPTEAVPPVPPGTPPPAPPAGEPAGAGGGGGNGKTVAIVVLVLAILGVGAFLLLSGGDDDDGDDVATEQDDDDEETTTTEAEDETTTTTEAEETTTSAPEESTTSSIDDGGGELAFTEITDDTGALVVEVPDTWTDVDGTSLGDGAPNVQASTDLTAFRELSASGISFTRLNQQNADPDTTLDFLQSGQEGGCTVEERQDYDDGVFTGRLQELSDCGGQGVTLIIIVASNAAGQTVEVSTVIVPPDPVQEIEQHIIETFNLTA